MLVSIDEVATLLPSAGPAIVVMPHRTLAEAVALMQRAEHVAGAIFAEHQELIGDGWGLENMIGAGVAIHSRWVRSYADKRRCMTAVAAFVTSIDAARNHREPIAQCLDEMLMNALYDAPIDSSGARIFAGASPRERITMRTDARVLVQYAYDGKRFALSVRDAFGSLERATVLRFLDKALHAREAVDQRAGGAGLGLYLMTAAATAVVFNVAPGVATQAACVFDLQAQKPQLEQLAFHIRPDTGGLVSGRPAVAIKVTPTRTKVLRGVFALIGAWLVVLCVLAVLRFTAPTTGRLAISTTRGATIELDGQPVGVASQGSPAIVEVALRRAYRVVAHLDGYETKRMLVVPHSGTNDVAIELAPVATVELDTKPSGANVKIDGQPSGSTPLHLTWLSPGAKVSIVFEHPGYRAATATLEVPRSGQRTAVVRDLASDPDVVRVHFISNPPGATIVRDGADAGPGHTFTPADLYLEAGKVQRFRLTMPKHAPLVIAPFTPARGSPPMEVGGDLSEH